jgi:hypothetical protein
MSEAKASIPKFGSFKPKPIPTVQGKAEKDRVESHQHERENSNSRHEHRKSRKSHSKERRRDTSADRHPSAKQRQLVEIEPPRPPPRNQTDDVFVIDRKGDVNNLVYGSIHRYSVPPFHRVGAGSVLGVPSYVRIDRDYADEKGVILIDRRNFKSSQREKYIFSKIERERPRLLKIRPDIEDQDSTEKDYVPLQIYPGKKRKRAPGGISGSEDGETNYRSIHGKAEPRDEQEDDNLEYATESDTSGSEAGRTIELDSVIRQKTVELSRKVEQSPHDIEAWLGLIGHQDIVVRGGDQCQVTNAELRSTADIKIHMYEQALEKARTLDDRETLLLGLMAEGGKIWEVKVQSERWEQLSKDNIDSLVLWKSYLNFRQSTFGPFQYEEIQDIFVQRIKLLLQAVHANTSHGIYDQIIYILLRLTTFIRESGYGELAIAIWQGLLEFNLCAPSKTLEPSEKLKLFRDFWESEIPRIGEDDALGWRHSVEHEGASNAPDAVNDEEGDILDIKDIFKSWATAEKTRARASRMPARTMDEVVEDDPFRVILVSDIEDFLIDFAESDEVRTSLLDAFLLFCRLPSLTANANVSRGWSSDPLIGESLLESEPAWIKRQYSREDVDSDGERQVDISSIFKLPVSNFRNSPVSMFSPAWFKSIRAWRDIYGGDNGPLQYRFLRNTLKQLLEVYFKDDLAEYYMAFEWRNEPETIRKVSKSLLKRHPSSLRLYNAYAMIEWSRGNREVANAVYSAALDMAKSMPENDQDGSTVLWASWIWAYLEARDKESALSRLLSIESGIPSHEITATPFQVLKTKQYLSQRRDYHLYSGSVLYAIFYAEFLALLEYLISSPSRNETQSSTQGNITAALEVYTNFSRTLVQTFKDRNISDTTSHELFLQFAARMLYQ